jgi:Na+/melibiose symporter-like transporter
MKWGSTAGITFIFICIILFEWTKLGKGQKKEKAALFSLALIAWALCNLLVFFTNIPGPTDFVDGIFKPLGKLLEK